MDYKFLFILLFLDIMYCSVYIYKLINIAEYVRNNLDRCAVISCKKASDVGMSMRPSNQTVVDTCRFLVDLGFIEPAHEETCVIS